MDKNKLKDLIEGRKSWIEILDDVEKYVTNKTVSETIRNSVEPLVKIYTKDIKEKLIKSHKKSDI